MLQGYIEAMRIALFVTPETLQRFNAAEPGSKTDRS